MIVIGDKQMFGEESKVSKIIRSNKELQEMFMICIGEIND